MLPCGVSPSFQHRNVLLPGVIIAPCADAGGAFSVAVTRPAISIATAASTVVLPFFVSSLPSFSRLGALPVSRTIARRAGQSARNNGPNE